MKQAKKHGVTISVWPSGQRIDEHKVTFIGTGNVVETTIITAKDEADALRVAKTMVRSTKESTR